MENGPAVSLALGDQRVEIAMMLTRDGHGRTPHRRGAYCPHGHHIVRQADGRIARYPVWSPNADWIAFASIHNASVQLLTQSTAGTHEEEPLLESAKDAILSDWS
jgi:hypothetical protein